MASFAAIYTGSDHEEAAKSLLGFKNLKNGILRKAEPWIQLDLCGSLEEVEPLARFLSQELPCDVIGVAAQTVSDSYGLWIYRNGQPRRALVYGWAEEGVWEVVSGDSQNFEAGVFEEEPIPGSWENGLTTFRFYDLGRAMGLPGFGDTNWSLEVELGVGTNKDSTSSDLIY